MTEDRATIESGGLTGRSWPWLRVRRDALFFLAVVVVLALDQLTKAIVRSNLALGEALPEEGFVRIVHVANTGAAFGILQGQTFFLTVTTFLGLAAILLYYLYPPMEHGLLRTALGLQLGGAIGNLTDRVRLGEVTDFIDFRYWPTFNVADSAIVIGVATIVIFFTFSETVWRKKTA